MKDNIVADITSLIPSGTSLYYVQVFFFLLLFKSTLYHRELIKQNLSMVRTE